MSRWKETETKGMGLPLIGFANICWITEKGREFQKTSYLCFIDYAKAFSCMNHNTLWKILKVAPWARINRRAKVVRTAGCGGWRWQR